MITTSTGDDAWPTRKQAVLDLLDRIDPIEYGRSRNYIHGAVTRLSPYISRGFLSTREVASHVLARGHAWTEVDSLLKELAWRDFFQQVWLHRDVDHDLIHEQEGVLSLGVPKVFVEHNTGILAIDQAIARLYRTGYIHNHERMYIASLMCNVAHVKWQAGAAWMYHYLLDADWASNALSWQWVAGTFSSKKYFANQENINKYTLSSQTGTWLDVPYSQLPLLDPPHSWKQVGEWQSDLPDFESKAPAINLDLPTYVYTVYNLDPDWGIFENANRVLLIEPSQCKKYPMCRRTWDFVLQLASNIPNLQIYYAEFEELYRLVNSRAPIHYKVHPFAAHFSGIPHDRTWMFPQVTGYFPSFFAYWKQCSRYLSTLIQVH